MRRFTQLFDELDATTRTGVKLAALERYFAEAPPRDAAWALTLLRGGKVIRAVSSGRLRAWLMDVTGYPAWLLNESYDAVGDLAETLALLLPDDAAGSDMPLHRIVEERILPLPRLGEREQRELVVQTWRELDTRQRFLFHKMIMGSFRVGVASQLVVRALANVAGVDAGVMAHRLAGQWSPGEASYRQLLAPDGGAADPARPYPFCLAYPLEGSLEALGEPEEWQAEWKWDGIRAQIIHRCVDDPANGRPADDCCDIVLVWSRGDELITDAFPELRELGAALPRGTVLDGEILAWEGDRPLPFGQLQTRINRKREEPRLWDESPVAFMAYDLLEWEGRDLRGEPLAVRRRQLEELVQATSHRYLRLSPRIETESWDALRREHARAREAGAEGMMLKRRDSAYGTGRQRGLWWKWKVDPFTMDAVMVYAQLGNGRRATLYTDYTFAVWHGDELVPVAKAYSGLTDEEIRQVDAWVRRNSLEKHGPVRVVKPELVFEVAFENIQASKRHKSGVAVRFPRIARWRHDKPAAEADRLETLQALLRSQQEQGLSPRTRSGGARAAPPSTEPSLFSSSEERAS